MLRGAGGGHRPALEWSVNCPRRDRITVVHYGTKHGQLHSHASGDKSGVRGDLGEGGALGSRGSVQITDFRRLTDKLS